MDRLGSEADGTGPGHLGTEAFRQQILPEGQNALAELLQPLQFGRGFATLGTAARVAGQSPPSLLGPSPWYVP